MCVTDDNMCESAFIFNRCCINVDEVSLLAVFVLVGVVMTMLSDKTAKG